MANPRNRGEENMAATDDDDQSQTESVTSRHGGNYLIPYSDYTTFLSKFVFDCSRFPSDNIYQSFVRFSLGPDVRSVSRSKVISDVTNIVGELKLKLISDFANLSNKVSVSADILCDYWHRYHFITITCHWFDETREDPLQKKLIACREFDVEHTAANISNMIHSVLKEYNLVGKVSSISFDNIIANKTSLDDLTQFCQSSIDCKFFHFKCINHVLSLCAQDGLASLRDHISPIRAAISRLTRSITLTNKWVEFCISRDLKPKKFLLDKPNRWNSTYKMLSNSFQYRETLCSFFEQQQCGIVLHPSQWDYCSNLCVLLKRFKEAIVDLSDVYVPTSCLVLENCVKIAAVLGDLSSCAYLGDCIAKMKEKWLKYFFRIPDVFLIAVILDPRTRVEGLEVLLNMYYNALFPIKNDDTPKPNEIVSNTKQLLFNIFKEYMLNNDESKDTTSSGDQDQASSLLTRFQNYIDEKTGKRRKVDSNPYQELEFYLIVCFDCSLLEKSFDILKFWSKRSRTFPVLYLIAKEILACPASTLSVEQAFSVEDCTLDERRSMLTVEDLENQCLLEDWTSAEARLQDSNLDTDDECDTYDDVSILRL